MGIRQVIAPWHGFAERPDSYRQLVGTMKALAPLVSFLNEPPLVGLRVDKRAHILHE